MIDTHPIGPKMEKVARKKIREPKFSRAFSS